MIGLFVMVDSFIEGSFVEDIVPPLEPFVDGERSWLRLRVVNYLPPPRECLLCTRDPRRLEETEELLISPTYLLVQLDESWV